ncbi:NADH:ubiquinone oxidoreductase subunit J [Streptomyces sp. NP160]|uniref:NADH-quinone oxidoreductase subunit J n=1 Tax=Streptomyces sp. NP160 TaxID=2586637 RepID=UPI001118F18F|nr:NADH-quinone oxidoreductase subunit J [Streptomyces sp. NP160]TNM60451.1 NADH:ubiquinone oxidoreductase subunit J [Streptomyces sp. NP160]
MSDLITGLVFWVLGVLAVVSGALVFRFDSMARATYALAVSFIAVGAALLLLQLDYVGLVTVLMMVMEMAVMAIYMIMFMGMNPALMPMSMVHSRRTALGISAGVFLVLAAGIVAVPWPQRRAAPAADLTASLGETIMGSKMLVMMGISPVLFATVVAAVVLAAPRTRYDRFGDDLRSAPSDPHHGGVGR